MHLFALLLTAAFASQFAAFSNDDSFTVTPTIIKSTGAAEIVVKQTDQVAAIWAGAVKIALALTKGQPADDKYKAATTGPVGADTKVTYNVTTADFADALTGIKNGDTVYVWVEAGPAAGTTKLATPAEIPVNDADFTVDPREVKFTATEDVVVTQIDTEVTNAWKTPVHLAFTLVNEQPTEGFVNAPAEGLSNAGGYKLSVEFLDKLPAVLPGDKIYVWVKVNAGHAADEEILEVPAVITVTAADFSVDIKSLHLAKAQAGGVTPLVLTGPVDTWEAAESMLVTLSSHPEGTENTAVIGSVVVSETAGVIQLALTKANWEALALTSSADKVYIFCTLASGTVLETVPAVIHILDDFTVLPKKAFQFDTKVLALKITPTAESWLTTKKIKVKLANETLSTPATDSGFFVTADGIAFANGAYTVGDAAFGAATFATHKKIWAYVAIEDTVGGNTFTYAMEPMTIEYVPTEFSITPPSVTDVATKVTGTIVTTENLKDKAKNNVVTVYILREPVENPEDITIPGKVTAADATGASYAYTDAPIPAGPSRLGTDDILYVYVSYVDKTNADTVTWLTHGRTMTVTEDPNNVRFTVSDSKISVDDISKWTSLTITQTIGKQWDTISVKITHMRGATASATSYEIEDVDMDDPDKFPVTLEPAKIIALATPQATDTYKIEVDKTNAGTGYHAKSATIEVTAGRLVSLETDEVELKKWKAGSTIEVKVDDSITWTAAMGIIVSLESGTDTVDSDIKKTGLTMTGGKVNVTIATGDLTSAWDVVGVDTVVYIFYSTDGAKKEEQTPAQLTVIEDIPVLQFDVSPKTIETTPLTITGLTITPKNVDATWKNQIDFTVTDTKNPDPTSNTVATINGTATRGTGPTVNVWTTDAVVSLTGFTLTDKMTLYVYCNKDVGTAQLPVPDTITVEAATEPAFDFTLSLTTITDEAMKANLAEMTVTPKTGTTFTDKTSAMGVFSTLAPTTAAQAHDDGVEVDLTFVAGTPAKYTMEGDEYKLEDVIPTTVPGKIYFYLKEKDTDAWSIFGAPIDVTKKGGDAAMGVSPLLSLLAALVFLFVKLF